MGMVVSEVLMVALVLAFMALIVAAMFAGRKIQKTRDSPEPVDEEKSPFDALRPPDPEMIPMEIQRSKEAPSIEEQPTELEQTHTDERSPKTFFLEPKITEAPKPEIDVDPIHREALVEKTVEPRNMRVSSVEIDDISPEMGVEVCPHCNMSVPSTLYCISCGKTLYKK